MATALALPHTPEGMQPDNMATLYGEALEARWFVDETTGITVFAQYADGKQIFSSPDQFGNISPDGRLGTLLPHYPLGPMALTEVMKLQIPATTAGGDGRAHLEARRLMEDVMPTGYHDAREELGAQIRQRVGEAMGRGLLPEFTKYQPPVGATSPNAVDVMPGIREIPLQVITDYLGFSKLPEMRSAIVNDSQDQIMALWGQLSEAEQLRCIAGFGHLWGLTQAEVKKQKPGEDNFTSRALGHTTYNEETQREEPTLSELEVAGTDINLVVAGHETTASTKGNGLRFFGDHPEAWDWVLRNPDRMGEVSREIIRLCGGIYSWTRIALKHTVVGGKEIEPGEHVMVLIGAANRDPRHFKQDPDSFIPTRDQKNDLAFGSGVRGGNRYRSHFCVGAGIAQATNESFFGAFAHKYPRFRLAHPRPPLKQNLAFVTHEALPLELEPSGS